MSFFKRTVSLAIAVTIGCTAAYIPNISFADETADSIPGQRSYDREDTEIPTLSSHSAADMLSENETVVIWADDIIAAGGNHQGSNGDTEKYDFGTFTAVPEGINYFFPDAAVDGTIGSYTRINGIDSGTGAWGGYAELTVTVQEAGNYTVYVLGNTNTTVRELEITNTANDTSSSIAFDGTEFSSQNYMKLEKLTVTLAAGDNTLKIQAPSGKAAPNLIAVAITGLSGSDNPETTDTPEAAIDMKSLIETGEVTLYNSYNANGQNKKNDEQTKAEALKLFDGDETNTSDFRYANENGSVSGNNGFVIFDFGAEKEVTLSKAEVLARSDQVGRIVGAVIQGTNVLPDDPYSIDGWATLTSAAVSSADWQTLSVGEEKAYRYLRFYNSSQWFGNAAELKLYGTVGDMAPTDDAKKELQILLDEFKDSDDVLYQKIYAKGCTYIEDSSVRLEQINSFITLCGYVNDSKKWIADDVNPWFMERLNAMLTDADLSAASQTKYIEQIEGFYKKGSELDENIIRDMGPEYVMGSEEKDMILADRIALAVENAKEQIDKYPDENYIMLKELISYMTRGGSSKYCDTPNKYGVDAATCEYVITNINYTLQNLNGNARMSGALDYKSGTTWLDKYGSKISAGGGQIIEGGDGKYYWYGEDNKVAYPLHTGVACYSTSDFSEWTYEGLVFNAFTDEIEANKLFADDFLTDPILDQQGRIERPKVLYNESNDTYVMWMHLEKNGNYGLSSAGVAVSSSGPTGPFEWKWLGRPVYDEAVTYNADLVPEYRDMTLFKDDDGTAYVIYASEANKVPYIVRLNDEYTWIDTEGMNTVTEEDFKSGKASYTNGMYYTGKMYKYNSDGTGYVDENGNDVTITAEDLKTLTYLDTSTNGEKRIDTNQGYRYWQCAKHNYYLPSFNRYQLAYGDRILIRSGDKVDRADGLDNIPIAAKGELAGYGRWAKIGQYDSGCSINREAPAVIKHNSYYYMVASGISGWKANAGIYLRASDLFGKWETLTNPFAGSGQTDYTSSYSYNNGQWTNGYMPDRSKSFLSQSTCLFEYNGTVYYMGDRWKDADYWDENHLGVKKSTYVWAPVTFISNGDNADNMEIYWTDSIEFSKSEPTDSPTSEPTEVPTLNPTSNPTEVPTLNPTSEPTEVPTLNPTSNPTEVPTLNPTAEPTEIPTAIPTLLPTAEPSPIPFEVISCNIDELSDGKAVLKNADIRNSAGKTINLYAAAYDANGALKSVKIALVPSGDNNVEVELVSDKNDTVKLFLWDDMQPVMEAKTIILAKPGSSPDNT